MWTASALAAFCLLGSVATVEDFVEVNSEITFIYHHANGLLLAIRHNECYYQDVSKLPEFFLQTDYGGFSRATLEWMITVAIGSRNFKPSSLDKLRNKFNDLLVDYHCLDKQLYELPNFFPGGGK